MENKKTITVGSLFCGIGGFCKAFEQEGATVLWANDFDKYVKLTYEENYKSTRFILEDIYKLSVVRDKLEPVDVLTAGFPCQPFSIAGYRKGFNDPRGNVFFEIIRIIKEFKDNKPKIIFLENVKNFRKDEYLDIVIKELNNAGYWFDRNYTKVLNTYDFTPLPQNRERLFMVALNRDYFENVSFNFPNKKINFNKNPFDYFETNFKAEPNYYFEPFTKYWKLFKEKMDEFDKPNKRNVYLLRRWYVRPYIKNYIPTLTANMGTGGHNVPVIKDRWGIRKLTVNECAKLQGFHVNWFKIPTQISRGQLYKQIGNSVTVPLVRKIARICIKMIQTI